MEKDNKLEEMLKQLFLSSNDVDKIVYLVKDKYQNKKGIDYLQQALKVGQYRLHEHREVFSKMIYEEIDEAEMKSMCNAIVTSELENAVSLGHVKDAEEYANMVGRKLTKEEIKTMGFRNLYGANNAYRVEVGMELLSSVDAVKEIDRNKLIKYSKANYGRPNLDISDDWDGACYALSRVASNLSGYKNSKI